MIPRAVEALRSADVVVGYKTYIDIISSMLEGKKVFSSGMRKEVERCVAAIGFAIEGSRVALVSSGDAGIYGMAGLVFDICSERGLDVRDGRGSDDASGDFEIEVIPGVSAFNAAASLLGAPLMHDFASISLSDHLTPWELIEKRLIACASADFVISIYNPRSRTRPDSLGKAREILLRFRSPETPVGIVRQAMRENEWKRIATLGELPLEEVDMQSVVLVGNSRTYVWNGWMATPRGYLDKYTLHSERQCC